jgi:uncharacterized protein (TIGR02246 family)
MIGRGTTRRFAAVVMAASVALMAAAATSRAAPPVEVVKQLAATMSASVASGDVDAYAALYAPDALLLPPNGTVISGRDNIRAVLAANQSMGANALAFGNYTVGGDENQAMLLWTWILTITPKDKPPIETRGRSLVDLRRLDGGWQIVTDMFQTY